MCRFELVENRPCRGADCDYAIDEAPFVGHNGEPRGRLPDETVSAKAKPRYREPVWQRAAGAEHVVNAAVEELVTPNVVNAVQSEMRS